MFVTRLYRSVIALMCTLALSLAQWGPAAAANSSAKKHPANACGILKTDRYQPMRP